MLCKAKCKNGNDCSYKAKADCEGYCKTHHRMRQYTQDELIKMFKRIKIKDSEDSEDSEESEDSEDSEE